MTLENRSLPRILLIGPVPVAVPSLSKPVGGASLNFGEMIRELSRRGFVLDIVDTNRPLVYSARYRTWKSNIVALLSVIRKSIVRVDRNDLVFLNGNPGVNIFWIAWTIWLLCKLRKRPLLLRMFGGNFADVYDKCCSSVRWLADRTILSCEGVFVQTQSIYRRFSTRSNFFWFPNTRDIPERFVTNRECARRFVFISRLYMNKGLREALEACRNLPSEFHLSVYGPRMPETDMSLFDRNDRVTYKGPIRARDVPGVLAAHDLLLFPSYWEAEGYPGIIIESMQCGTPVIATRWRSIPEIVEHEKNGLLVAPRSADSVRRAINRVIEDDGLYRRLRRGAKERGEMFRSSSWYDRMAKILSETSRRI